VWRRGQILVGTSKGTSHGEFVIVARFGGHALHHLASIGLRMWAGKQTKNLVFAIFKNPYSSFYNCCIILCTISGFSNVKAV